jgi:hypothetical protein
VYKDLTSPTIRLTIGTERAGLTYHLSHKRLEKLSSGFDKNAILMHKAKTNKSSMDEYYLERSYLNWLDRLSFTGAFGHRNSSEKRPPRPFVDRVHDWTFRMNPRIKAGHFFQTSEDISDFLHGDKETVISLIQQSLAMCLAAFAYGDLHLLAWHAPFHAPIYGLLWKTSGFTIAGLGVLPLLAVSIFFGIRFASPGDKKRRVSRSLGWPEMVVTVLLYVGACFYMLLYISARVYLVVESFLSLAYLPESALTTPNFSLYFPHIG